MDETSSEAAELRAQQFATAMQSADPPVAFPERARAWAWGFSGSIWARGSSAGFLALAILLVLRPPFVLSFHYDSRRPWRASTQMCWFALTLTALLVAAAAALLPLLC